MTVKSQIAGSWGIAPIEQGVEIIVWPFEEKPPEEGAIGVYELRLPFTTHKDALYTLVEGLIRVGTLTNEEKLKLVGELESES